jgi:anti-sigma factor RsiW
MISCEDFITELGSLLDNELAAEIREQLEAHLAHCNTCQVLYDSTRKTLRIVTDSGSFEYPEPLAEPLVNKIMERIRSGCARR